MLTSASRTPGFSLLDARPCMSRVRGASVTIPRVREREMDRDLSLIEGCRGQGQQMSFRMTHAGWPSLQSRVWWCLCASRRISVTDRVALSFVLARISSNDRYVYVVDVYAFLLLIYFVCAWSDDPNLT